MCQCSDGAGAAAAVAADDEPAPSLPPSPPSTDEDCANAAAAAAADGEAGADAATASAAAEKLRLDSGCNIVMQGSAAIAVLRALDGTRQACVFSHQRDCWERDDTGAPGRVAAAVRLLRNGDAAVAPPRAPQAPCRGGENRSDFCEPACKTAECMIDGATDADRQAGSAVHAGAAAAAAVLAVAGSVFGYCVAFPRAMLSSVAAWIRRTEDVGGAGKTIVVPGNTVTVWHSPTEIELTFTKEQMRAANASLSMKEYAAAVAAAHTPGQAWSDLIRLVPSTSEKAAAATAIACLLNHPSTKDCGITWIKRGVDGNKLYASGQTDNVCVTGYGTYGFTDAPKLDSKRQAKNTLAITPELATVINETRDKLVEESLDGEAITLFNLPADRPMVGFVFGLAFMLEEMQREANGARFIGGHFVNTADKMSKFAFHVDDHDEHEPGGSYIEHSVLAMCSPGASSIAFAPIGEVHYQGPGSIIKFRAWIPHRSALVKPEPAKAPKVLPRMSPWVSPRVSPWVSPRV